MKVDVNTSKTISEEVSKALNVSSIHIDTYRLDGKITLLFGHTIDYDGGGVTDNLDGELKDVV